MKITEKKEFEFKLEKNETLGSVLEQLVKDKEQIKGLLTKIWVYLPDKEGIKDKILITFDTVSINEFKKALFATHYWWYPVKEVQKDWEDLDIYLGEMK